MFCQRLFSQNQFAIKLGLENMRAAILFESQRIDVDLLSSHPAILIAGTNGKGSTAAFISAILQAHGLRVGLYTSPHLVDFRERFRVNGQVLPEALVERIGNEVLEHYGEVDGPNLCLTFFELTTMMAIRLFNEEKIDVGVYEIGLGGRLDAVNALEPTLSVITSIDFDHGQYLGTTLEEIAREKCGIFRSSTRAVVGFQEHAQALRQIELLAPENTLFYGRNFADSCGRLSMDLQSALQAAPDVLMYNAQTAVAASRSYLEQDFNVEKTAHGLTCMRWPGRMDLRKVHMTTAQHIDGIDVNYLLDAAHNDASVRALFKHLKRENILPGAIVLGAMADKALDAMFVRLVGMDVPVFGVEIANQRAASSAQLETAVLGTGDSVNTKTIWRGAGTCAWAFEMAGKTVADSGRPILVFGSIYLLGEFFDWAGISADELITYEEVVAS